MYKSTCMAAALATILALIGAWAASQPAAGPDKLEILGARATEGAAAGYVDDAVCGRCHVDKYKSYQKVGMAQSFKRPQNAIHIEDFGKEFYHEASQRYYQILENGDGLLFRRYQRADDGGIVNRIEIPIDWVVGSGNRARSYLYQTDWGELYFLPINWYSEDQRWGMSPGFEDGDHPGIHRQIPRKCMFCHNAFPEVPEGSDRQWIVETFPHTLPEGTGCQRCHGPGAEHIRTVLRGGDIEAIHAAIVNPARLPPVLRDSVCFQCHLLPSAALAGTRRFGFGDYAFRPGQNLSDYLVPVDVREEGLDPVERFEINHHGYRFFRSRCYQESGGELACISCHDPHVKPESAAFRASVREVCTGCHANVIDLHEPDTDLSGGACVGCHMPQRRTGDVILVTMTDHRIARGPFDHDTLVAPRDKDNRVITAVDVLDFGDPPSGTEADAYRTLAALRSGRNVIAAQRGLEVALEDLELTDTAPYVDLASAQFNAGRYDDAEDTARKVIASGENLRPAYTVLGSALLAQGQRDAAMDALQTSLELEAEPEAHFNLAAALIAAGDYAAAEQHLDAAIELRPNLAVAWKYKARLLAARNERRAARDAFVHTLALQPLDLETYGELINLLRELGEPEIANRYLQVGLRTSRMLSEIGQ